MKRIIPILLLLWALPLWGQPPGMRIRPGQGSDRAFFVMMEVADSLSGEPVPFASVYLKPAKDTIITNFTLSDAKGKAFLSNVVRGEYSVNVEMMGYLPYRKVMYFTSGKDLGRILMKEDKQMLEAATVSAAVAPVEMKGDTLVYNAAAYSIAENDVLRDLLKKMPGIEVEEDGSVKVQGESVNQITVNGRTFFMGDKRAALDNLPAKAVEKIKVTDHESDMEKVTGIRNNSATRSRNMDVSLKQEYKNGTFGNLQAHGGASLPSKDQDEMLASIPFLWNTSGLLSTFREKDQLTFIGRGQNVENGSRMVVRQGSGLTTGGQAGVNYNTDRIKKADAGVSIYYNGTSKDNASRSSSEEFPLSGDEVHSVKTSNSTTDAHQVTASLSLRPKRNQRGLFFDFDPRITFRDQSSVSTSTSASEVNGVQSNRSNSNNSSKSRSLSSNGRLTFAYGKFAKKGRSVSVNGQYNIGGSKGDSRDYSLTQFAASGASSERDLHYDNNGGNGSGSLSLGYAEPIADKWKIQTTMDGSVSRSRQNKDAFNADGSANDYYTTASLNRSLTGRGAVLAQYSTDKSVLQAGISVNSSNLYTYSKSLGQEKELGIGEWQWNWAPQLSYAHGNTFISYQGHSSQPNQEKMISLLDITDPLRISTGNIYLRPGFTHSLSFRAGTGRRRGGRVSLEDRLSGAREMSRGSINVTASASMNQNSVVSATWYDADRVRYTVPVNTRRPAWSANTAVTGYRALDEKQYWRLMLSGMVKFRSSVNYQPVGTLAGIDSKTFDYNAFMASFWGDNSGNRFYDGSSGFRESLTRQLSYNATVDLTYSNPRKFRFTFTNSFNGSNAWYSLDNKANTNTYVYTLSLDATYTTTHQFKLNGYYSMQRYFGYSDSFSKLTNALNFTVTKDWRAFTFSAQARDILNNGLTVSHSVSETGTTDSYRLSMGRHFLLGVTWRFGRMGNMQMNRANRASEGIQRDF